MLSGYSYINNILIALSCIAGSFVAGQILKYILNKVFRRLFASTKTTLDDRLLAVIRPRIVALSVLAGTYIAVLIEKQSVLPENVTYRRILDYSETALYIIAVFVITRLLSKFIETAFEWYMDDVSAKTHSNITATVAPMTKKIVELILFMIAGMIVLDHFGINIGSLLVSLGVGSLAVALAAQETVANMIAGFVILVDQPFRVGDRIRLQSGEEGDVYQIGLRSTRILNYDNNLVLVPNSELVKTRIVNYSYPDQKTRIVVDLKISYGTDVDRARKILTDLAGGNDKLLKDPAPNVFFLDFGDLGIVLRLIAFTPHFDNKFGIETSLRELIYKGFSEAGISIPAVKFTNLITDKNESKIPEKK